MDHRFQIESQLHLEESENRNEIANLILATQLYPCLEEPSVKNDVISVYTTYPEYPISCSMFPIITKVLKIGHYVEGVYLNPAEFIYMYEVGPLKVSSVGLSSKRSDALCYHSAEYPGFYYVTDQYGEAIYPSIVKRKVQSHIQDLQPMLLNEEVKLNSNKNPLIGLSLEDWPHDVFNDFKNKLLWLTDDKKINLEDTTLHLVSKNHPRSTKPNLEWKLSFSSLKKVIIQKIPKIHKKAYLICRSFIKEYLTHMIVPIWHLKNAFLWKMDDYGKTENLSEDFSLLELVRNIFQKLNEFYKSELFPNYFLPASEDNNLLHSSTNNITISNEINIFIKDLHLTCNRITPYLGRALGIYRATRIDINGLVRYGSLENIPPISVLQLELHISVLTIIFQYISMVKRINDVNSQNVFIEIKTSFMKDLNRVFCILQQISPEFSDSHREVICDSIWLCLHEKECNKPDHYDKIRIELLKHEWGPLPINVTSADHQLLSKCLRNEALTPLDVINISPYSIVDVLASIEVEHSKNQSIIKAQNAALKYAAQKLNSSWNIW